MVGQAPPSLSLLVDRIRLSGTVVGLAFVFATMTIALILQWRTSTLLEVAIVLIPLIVAIWALVRLDGSPRSFVVSAATFACLPGVLLVPTPQGFLWPPIASLAFGFGVVAVSSLPSAWGIGAIIAASIATRFGVISEPPPTLLISTDLMDGWVTPLSVLSLCAALLIVLNAWTRAAARADDSARQVRSQLRESLLAERVNEARRAVDRRLHETVLNTLAAFTSPVHDVATLREQCAQDLMNARRVEPESLASVDEVIDEASRRVPRLEVDLVSQGRIPLAEPRVARVLCDALVELLRNVERHAGTYSAIIRSDLSQGQITIKVEDEGVGVDRVSERFGLRSAVQDAITSIGGTVRLEPRAPRGTRVTITLPVNRASRDLQPPTSLTVLLGSPWARIALGPTLVLGIFAIPFAIVGFHLAPAILIGFLVTVLSTLALAVLWNRAPRRALASIVLFASFATMGIAAFGQDGCETATGMHWIIYAEAGAVGLSILSFHAMSTRVCLVVATLVVSVAASLPTPRPCRLESMDAAVENIVWIASAIAVVSLLSRLVDRRRADEYALWLDLQESEANVAAAESSQSRWVSVSDRTWEFLSAVANGHLDPNSPTVVHRAAVEEARIRTLLDSARIPSEQLREECEKLAEVAAGRDVPLAIVVIDDDPHAKLGESRLRQMTRILESSPGEPIQLTISSDSVLITASDNVVASPGAMVLGDLGDGRWVMQIERRSPGDDAKTVCED